MVMLKEGLLSRSRNKSSSSCSGYSTARFYTAPDYFQRQ